jgi:hypothetical protein
MKILTKIWKKLLNEAGIPVLHIIDKRRESFIHIWKIEKTPQIRQFARYPLESFDVISFRLE